MSDSGWAEMNQKNSLAKRQLQLALGGLKRLQEGQLPENEKRIAAATYLECLLSSLAATLLYAEAEAIVQDILQVYDRIWHG